MPLAGPQAFGVPYQFELVHSAHHLAILYGYPGTFRTIPTDGGPHPADPDPTWMGDSIGHWEGDTLVVDSVGFNDKTQINGFLHTEALHIVERFGRTDYNTLQYEATLEDPNVWVKPFTVTRSFALRPDLSKVDEFVCEHAFIYLEVTDEKGAKAEWQIEMMSLNHLKSYGWTHDTVKPGDVISCTGGSAKSGDPAMLSSLIKLADGRMIKS